MRCLRSACIFFLIFWAISTRADTPEPLYIGTYTGAKSQGIYLAHFDDDTGALSKPELAAATRSPSFLALHPSGKFLYAVNEVSDFAGKHTGAVSAYSVDRRTGKLELLNQVSTGDGPCHLSVDKSGSTVLAANYGGGNVHVLRLARDGKLIEKNDALTQDPTGPGGFVQHHGSSVNKQRQSEPHAHFILPDPRNRFALACDLGLDKVFSYPFDSKAGTLDAKHAVEYHSSPGAGPRHLAFHPSGNYAYVINEMGSSISACRYDQRTGKLTLIGTISTLPADFKGQSTCAEVQVQPSGRFVYGSNRGDDSLAVFAVDDKSGGLTLVEHQSTHGKTPRHFTLSPNGSWLLCGNQDSDSISVFRVARDSGKLTYVGTSPEIGSPVCLIFAENK